MFDLVVSRLALHHLEEPARAVFEMARVCRAGGRGRSHGATRALLAEHDAGT